MKNAGRSRAAIFVAVAALCASQAALAQSAETYKVRLTPVPIDASMMAFIAGSGSLSAVLSGDKLTISGNFARLRSPASEAQIHRGAKGVRGPAILDLVVSRAASGSVSGSVTLSPAQIEDLRNSRLYVQIDSEGAPEGNLWGWLLR